MTLPTDFPHQLPEGYSYETEEFKANITSIWIRNHARFSYTNDPIRSIWGFAKFKRTKRSTTHTYHAPINSNKVGKEVSLSNTTAFSAMPLLKSYVSS